MLFSKITTELAALVEALSKKLKEDTDEFKKLYEKLCIHWGGADWKKTQYEALWRHVRHEILPIMEAQGLDRKAARVFCSGAENCLITDAPFMFYKKAMPTLVEAQKLVEADSSEREPKEKWDAAFAKVAEMVKEERRKKDLENRRITTLHHSLYYLPLPNPGEDLIAYRYRVLQNIKSFLECGELQPALVGTDFSAVALASIYDLATRALGRHEDVA